MKPTFPYALRAVAVLAARRGLVRLVQRYECSWIASRLLRLLWSMRSATTNRLARTKDRHRSIRTTAETLLLRGPNDTGYNPDVSQAVQIVRIPASYTCPICAAFDQRPRSKSAQRGLYIDQRQYRV